MPSTKPKKTQSGHYWWSQYYSKSCFIIVLKTKGIHKSDAAHAYVFIPTTLRTPPVLYNSIQWIIIL